MADNQERKVKPRDPIVEIEYTDKAKHHKKGDVSKVHQEQANKLISTGVAVKKGDKQPDSNTQKTPDSNTQKTPNSLKGKPGSEGVEDFEL